MEYDSPVIEELARRHEGPYVPDEEAKARLMAVSEGEFLQVLDEMEGSQMHYVRHMADKLKGTIRTMPPGPSAASAEPEE